MFTKIPSAVWMQYRIFLISLHKASFNVIIHLLNHTLISRVNAFSVAFYFSWHLQYKVCCIRHKHVVWTHSYITEPYPICHHKMLRSYRYDNSCWKIRLYAGKNFTVIGSCLDWHNLHCSINWVIQVQIHADL